MQTIRWLDASREVISSSSDQQLRLPFTTAEYELNNTVYTCEVVVMLATETTTIQDNVSIELARERLLIVTVIASHV